MKGYEKSGYQKKSGISAAGSSGTKAIQKKSVSVIQNAAHKEELQQHKLDATVQKVGATDLEEKHKEVTQHKTSVQKLGATDLEENHKGVTQNKSAQENQNTENLVQAKENKTGMPDNLKSGIENLSGMSMDHVRVNYNSSQPAQLNALAYAQGSDIHIAPGQEKHLPHEAWHVVQQAQGRVQPTKQMKTGVPVNDDPGLEHEADVMGEKALNVSSKNIQKKRDSSLTQLMTKEEEKPAQLLGDIAQRKESVAQLETAEERAQKDAMNVQKNILLIARKLGIIEKEEIKNQAKSFTVKALEIMSEEETFVIKCRKLREKQDEIRKYIKTAKLIIAGRKLTPEETAAFKEVLNEWEL